MYVSGGLVYINVLTLHPNSQMFTPPQDREAGNDDGHSASGSQAGRALDPAKQAQRVYVGNLSWNVDREQLRQHMAEVCFPCGIVCWGPGLVRIIIFCRVY